MKRLDYCSISCPIAGLYATYFQNGNPSDEPTTLVGMPKASRITPRSCDPRPPKILHMRLDDGLTGRPPHSSIAVAISSCALASLSAASSDAKSVNFSGNVPD